LKFFLYFTTGNVIGVTALNSFEYSPAESVVRECDDKRIRLQIRFSSPPVFRISSEYASPVADNAASCWNKYIFHRHDLSAREHFRDWRYAEGSIIFVRVCFETGKKNIYTGQIHQAHSVCNYLRLAGRHRAGRFANFYILHSAGDIFVSCAAFLYTILARLPN
jgi:hypothetical protein